MSDPEYATRKELAYRKSVSAIHNYFFLKGLDTVREGGIMAFITSQGVMNGKSPFVRMELMKQANLVTALRLPNNTFTDSANTEVGSDLIILQKRSGKTGFTRDEELFMQAFTDEKTGIPNNRYFMENPGHIVCTGVKEDTDPYGKPALVYSHSGGVEGIGDDMRQILYAAFGRNLNLDLYNGNKVSVHPVEHKPKNTTKKVKPEPAVIDVQAEEIKPEPSLSQDTMEIETKGYVPPVPDKADDYDPKIMMYNLFGELVEIPGAKKKRRNNKQGLPKEQKAPAKETKNKQAGDPRVQTAKPHSGVEQLSEDDLKRYGSLDWDENPPINGFYTTMMEIAHRQLAEQEAERIRTEREKNPVVPDGPYIEMTEGDFIPGVPSGVKKRTVIPIEETPQEPDMSPRPYSEDIMFFHKNGSMVCDRGQVGFLTDVSKIGATFTPLALNEKQMKRAMLYITLSETYQQLYHYEGETHEPSEELREHLNQYYDEYVQKYGHLNERENVKFIKMDANGCDALALERGDNGIFVKADIFDHPVAFAVDEVTSVNTPLEALSASLNKYGTIDFGYMGGLVDMDEAQLVENLEGRIFYNPLVNEYEISDRFLAGNVVRKVELIEQWIADTDSHDKRVENSLSALKEAFPRRIEYEELDFNFGERWIPPTIYGEYMSYLYETQIKIAYSSALDTYSATESNRNAKINHEYCVKGQFRRYDGMALLRHALHNTTPEIKKSIGKDANGKDILVPDPEAIQLASNKIDEIRDGFTAWLNGQSDEFKERLVDMYNRRFNCFARPRYDGSHQTLPGLNMKLLGDRLGVNAIYQSQKD